MNAKYYIPPPIASIMGIDMWVENAGRSHNYQLVNYMRHLIIIAISLLAASCTGSGEKAAANLLGEIRQAYAEERDSECLVLIDTLRSRFPKAVAERKAALSIYQEASLRRSQRDLAHTDSALQAVAADYAGQKQTVEQRHAAGIATSEELTALTRLRIRRDSLQTRFDVLCAQIKYIHKRQKQLRP